MAPEQSIALTLAAAMVASSSTPVLLLDGRLGVVAASRTFCRVFGIDPGNVTARSIFSLGSGEWEAPRLRSLLTAIASGGAEVESYEFELASPGRGLRQLVLHAHRLDYDNSDGVRLLLALNDVTEARVHDKQRDDLVREKAVLIQEMQHRVANSLQIIASVLMQSARKTQSEETRGHLNDAHHRVMSVAAVQRQLTVATLGQVALRQYLTQLCQSISASMIHDPAQLTLVADVDGSSVSPDVSISLGLIVTELVINALKHAFPRHRHGRITVVYTHLATGWALSVTDDGVGMPPADTNTAAGLGTTIVQALAKQLHASVQVTDMAPGTRVMIRRSVLKLVDREVTEPELEPV